MLNDFCSANFLETNVIRADREKSENIDISELDQIKFKSRAHNTPSAIQHYGYISFGVR